MGKKEEEGVEKLLCVSCACMAMGLHYGTSTFLYSYDIIQNIKQTSVNLVNVTYG